MRSQAVLETGAPEPPESWVNVPFTSLCPREANDDAEKLTEYPDGSPHVRHDRWQTRARFSELRFLQQRVRDANVARVRPLHQVRHV